MGIPAIPEGISSPSSVAEPVQPYKKSPAGRKPKDRTVRPKPPEPIHSDAPERVITRQFPDAGRLTRFLGMFETTSNAGWGTNTDMAAIAHGPVGCGVFTQSKRDVLPGRFQGIESFSELHISTDLDRDELDADGGGTKLARGLDELLELFPPS